MKTARLIALIFGLPLVVGCSTAQEYPEDPVVRYGHWAPGDESMLALLEGTLEISQGCLVVRADETNEVSLVAFPRSLVEWDAAAGILTYNGAQYRIGDHVSLGGGGVPLSSDVDMSEACRALDAPSVFLLQHTSLRV